MWDKEMEVLVRVISYNGRHSPGEQKAGGIQATGEAALSTCCSP